MRSRKLRLARRVLDLGPAAASVDGDARCGAGVSSAGRPCAQPIWAGRPARSPLARASQAKGCHHNFGSDVSFGQRCVEQPAAPHGRSAQCAVRPEGPRNRFYPNSMLTTSTDTVSLRAARNIQSCCSCPCCRHRRCCSRRCAPCRRDCRSCCCCRRRPCRHACKYRRCPRAAPRCAV